MEKKLHYPTYDVLTQVEHWDQHTQMIVLGRLEPLERFRFFSPAQEHLLLELAARLSGDPRPKIGQSIVKHLDESLAAQRGEGQRSRGSLPRDQLLTRGLAALEQTAVAHFLAPFVGLSPEKQKQLLTIIQGGAVPYPELWRDVDGPLFIQKLVELVVEAYYSHPDVWSDIGYGGPAYPRGYVRTEEGQVDPWEAVQEQ